MHIGKLNSTVEEMDWNLEYGELAKEKDFVNTCETLKENLISLQGTLDQLLPLRAQYDKMTISDQIELEIFFLYTFNSLNWINLRLQGVDVNNHPIKKEMERIKAVMVKYEQAKDRDKRPTVNVEAAKRFVRSGLYDPSQIQNPPNKKTKFTDDED